MVSFSHGEYFYSLFSETINTELLKNLDLTVLELMKSSVDNPKMVMKFLFFIFTLFTCSMNYHQTPLIEPETLVVLAKDLPPM